MIDAHFVAKTNAVFEAALANMTPQRTSPKSYTPTPKDRILVPWYLDWNKGTPPDSELP